VDGSGGWKGGGGELLRVREGGGSGRRDRQVGVVVVWGGRLRKIEGGIGELGKEVFKVEVSRCGRC
jgi:hypothetical protein